MESLGITEERFRRCRSRIRVRNTVNGMKNRVY